MPAAKYFSPVGAARSARTLLGASALLAAVSVFAQTAPEISGFGTLGVTHERGAGGRGYVRNSTQPGTSSSFGGALDSRLGAQFDWAFVPDWEASVQAVAVKRPQGTPASESVERAYIGWRPLANTRLRAGRINPDIFLYADSRNVGYSLPWARPPVDFYGFAPVVAIDGLDLDQQWHAGDADWRLRVTHGSARASVTDLEGARVPLRGRGLTALALNRFQDGLLLKLSFLQGHLGFDAGDQVAALRQGLDEVAGIPVPGVSEQVAALQRNLWTEGNIRYLSLAAQYETGPWTLIGEASNLTVPNSPLASRRAYASAGYRRNGFTYYVTAGAARPRRSEESSPDFVSSLSPVVGEAVAQQAQALGNFAVAAGNNFRYDQNTVGIGVRWDFSSNAALKLQWDRFRVASNGGAGLRYFNGAATDGQILTVLVDFVWGQ